MNEMNTPSDAQLAAEEILASTEIELLSFPSHESALEKLSAIITKHFPPQQPLPVSGETPRDGHWLDQWGACKVCGGEIPHGHANSCDIYKLEMKVATERAAREKLEHQLKRGKAHPTEAQLGKCPECDNWTVTLDMMACLKCQWSADGMRQRAEAAESQSGDVAKALNAYPDFDLVSLATTLEATRRKAEVVFPLAQKLVEAVHRIHIGPESRDDCDVCRATKELAAVLASVPAETERKPK